MAPLRSSSEFRIVFKILCFRLSNKSLNESRLSGIGTFQFAGCNEIVLDENLSGYCLIYAATHGADDNVPEQEQEEGKEVRFPASYKRARKSEQCL